MKKEEAIRLYNSNWWEGKTVKEICDFQMYEEKLCMPFDLFHKAVEECLNRSIWTHEFADWEGMKSEYEGKQEAPQSPLESLQRIAPHLAGRVIIINPNDPIEKTVDKIQNNLNN